MKNLAVILALSSSLVAGLAGISAADPAPKGPDFTAARPAGGVDPSLSASGATTPIMPSDVIGFRHNSDVVTEGALSQVMGMVAWMKKHPDQKLVLEGHTDKQGTKDYNEDLASRRADAVRTQLMLRGISSDRIVLEIYGDVGSRGKVNELDRAVIVSTSTAPLVGLVDTALEERHALTVTWTDKGTLFTESMSTHAAAKAKRVSAR